VEEFTTQDLIEELQAYCKRDERKPGGVTITEWAEAQGLRRDNARIQLKRMCDEGVLFREKPRVDGTPTFVYYKAKPEALA